MSFIQSFDRLKIEKNNEFKHIFERAGFILEEEGEWYIITGISLQQFMNTDFLSSEETVDQFKLQKKKNDSTIYLTKD
jgi:hypothetical protein